ncbi:C45 family peptidase [Streptomyces sp. NBC_01304]|uniref:C45 family peptidase n=1 Tax=Streptomyces sp. NBC_01304 TaxID=2903818 RepID=UPI002E148BEE|nr:carcinine hydrolase/isopenicillin-N N-acyltransferase family protein [Streptomyces sp. NBC_01304]
MPTRNHRRTAAAALTAVCALLAGCSGTVGQVDIDPGPSSVAPSTAAPPPTAKATLATLTKVDDHPLWTMTYQGGYGDITAPPTPAEPTPAVARRPFACSLFLAAGDKSAPLFGRNFDWDEHPALLLFTDPPGGHASVSVVDTSYLGVNAASDFTKHRDRLLKAPLLPFDGMNDKGVAIGMASVTSAEPPPGGKPIGSVRIQRLVLDRADSVPEALRLFKTYAPDFTGGPPLHYVVADAAGRSALVEYVDGKVVVHRGEATWNAAVNFIMTGSDRAEQQADDRYRTLGARLTATDGALSTPGALQLLEDVAQQHTRWSVVYGLKTGKVSLVTGQHWRTVHEFELPMR